VLRVDATALLATAKEEEEPVLPTLPTQRRGMRVESKRILTRLYGYRKAKSYEDSMASTHPGLAAELDIEGCQSMGLDDVSPENIMAGTNVKLAWQCLECDHR
jgi:hypothetical protein